jgi:HlyD family secretion protein
MVRAGVTGTVYNIKVSKTGSTVQPGDEMLSIVPDGEALMLEANVQNQDVGFIKTGMRVKVKLATFPYQEYGMVEGTVNKISPNAVNEKDAGLVFPVQVQLKQRSVRVNDREVLLSPGMAASAEIVTRQKTVMSFLLDPITASWDQAFSVR